MALNRASARSGALLSKLELEIGYGIIAAGLRKGLGFKAARHALLKHCGVPLSIRKSDGGPGDHGIPEIGAHEAAFHEIVMGGGDEALRSLKDLVNQLYEEGRGWADIDPYAFDEPVEEWKNRAVVELATKPLEAYLLGQLFATEALDRPTTRPLQPDDRKAVEFLEHYAFNEISSKFDELKGDIRREVIAGVESGENPRDVARRLSNTLDDYETNFGLIAITETARAESQGRLQEFEDQNVLLCEGSSAHDSHVCDKCRELIDGKQYPVEDVIGVSNYGRKQDAWLPCIPLHPRCRCVWLPVN